MNTRFPDDKASMYFHLLLRNTPNGVLILDKDGIVQLCSARLAQWLGIENGRLVEGWHFNKVYGLFEDNEGLITGANVIFNDVKERCILREELFELKFPGCKDKSFYTIQSIPLLDSDGVFFGVYVLYLGMLDLSQSITKDQTRLILDSVPMACTLRDRYNNIIDCNMETLRIFGAAKKADIINNFPRLSPKIQPDGMSSKEKGEKLFERCINETGREQYEWTYLNTTGQEVLVETTTVRTSWHGQNYVLSYSRDLRETREKEEKERKANERVRVLLDAMPLACVVHNEQSQTIDCNLEALRMFGVTTRDEFLEHFFDNMPEYQPDGSLSSVSSARYFRTAFETGYASFDWMHKSQTGELIPASITLVRVEWDGAPGLAAYMRDMRAVRAEEKKAREAEERTLAMLDATPLSMSMWDENCHVLDCNMEAVRMFNLTKKADCIEHFMDLQPDRQPDGMPSRAKKKHLIREAFRTGLQKTDWNFRMATGEILPVEMTLVRIPWRDGFRVVSYSRDMREIIAKENEARRAETRTKAMLEATPLSCIFLDETAKAIDCNAAALKLFGLESKEELLVDFFQLVPEKQPNGLNSIDEKRRRIHFTFETGYSHFEWVHLTASGEELPSDITLVRVEWDGVYCIAAYIRDLRELRRNEHRAREAQENMRVMLDKTPLICILRDEKLNVVDCNQPAVALFGFRTKKELCSYYRNIVQPEQENGIKDTERMRAAIKSGYEQFYFIYRTLSGALVPMETTVVRIDREDGLQLIEYARDLRESVENQRKLNEMNERNLELDFERKEAHRAREAALEASKVKSDFLASMSHEIRTPMNAIIGMSDLMRTDNLDDTQKLYFADISKMAHSLLQIINDILDFSKIEAGKMELVPTHYNIRALYDNICSITRFTLANKSLSFVQGISDDMPDILFGDETRVRQIINNLLSNSVKYTLEGYIELRLSRVNRRDRDYFSITVSDTGVGIREEDLPRLFDKFAQFDVGSHKTVSGTGLGLPITKQFVEMMNGSMTVQSEYGKGSTFTVYLPLVLGDPAHLKQVETLKRVIASPEVKVLVVDDNAINLTVARGYLLRHGIDAETAESGAAAIEMLKKRHYDLVFMDHMMPEMDGIEATLLIRQMDGGRLKKMPIVALTANAIVGMREVFLGAGMDGYISKPINPQELNHALMTLLPPEMLTISDETVPASLTPLSPASLSALNAADLVLDQRVGVANFQSDEKLYKKILGDFQRNHGTDFETIISMLLAGDVQGARRVAHTLKSTGATIGAENLRRTAFAVETALAEKGQCGDDVLELLGKELTRVLDELKSILPAPAQTEAEERPIQREAGLKNVANDEKLYLKLLHEFRKSSSGDMSKLDEALAGNDFVTAHRIVHTLKGTAALIGAQKLHRIAASVVLELKDQKKNDAQLALLRAAFNEVMGELALLSDNTTSPRASSTGVVDRKKMHALLEKLEASLLTGSADSLGLMDELQGTLSACGVDYAALEAKMNDLDFPGALDALLALRQTLDATDEGESSGSQA